MKALLAAIAILVVLAGGFALALRSGALQSGPPAAEPLRIAPEAADSAEAKLDRLTGMGEEIQLTESELTSLLRYRPDDWSVGLVSAPTVRLSGDTILLSGTIDPDQLPSRPDIDAVRLFLPDTTRIDAAGVISPLDPGSIGVEITFLEIAGMPFPSSYFPYIVDRLGLPGDDRLPEGGFAITLPAGIGTARAGAGVLVLSP